MDMLILYLLLMNELMKWWPESQLTTAINCLTYGVTCLYFDRNSKTLFKCVLSIHEEFINIIHVIVEGKHSVLFQLHNIRAISDRDIAITNVLTSLNFEHFIILYTGNLDSHILVMNSQNEKNVLWEGIQYFVHQANHFYNRTYRMDPFKAEATLIFLEADTDGSSLLDIEQIIQIFKTLKINCEKEEIQKNILQINNDLYELQNLSRPKGFTKQQLTPLGFQYLLRFYSMKVSLTPLFSQFCPVFKFKHKKFKKTIPQILKNQNKPLMSGIQLKQFLQKYLLQTISEQQSNDLIRTFPIYDGEGKQMHEDVQCLSFNNFCNLLLNYTNTLIQPDKLQVNNNMNLPLNEYYIYSSSNTYLSGVSTKSQAKLQMYEHTLKKGCRNLEIDISIVNDEAVVKNKNSRNLIRLQDVLKTIKNIGFTINRFPIILTIQVNFPDKKGQDIVKLFKQQLSESLKVLNGKQKYLPSPLDLCDKIILHTSVIPKNDDNPFYSIVSFIPFKFDFERKNYTSNGTCQLKLKEYYQLEKINEMNLVDYCRKVLVKTSPIESNHQLKNYDPMAMFRCGAQMISFNLQIEDEYHYFIHSKFLQNGGKKCGYLLKPEWMHGKSQNSLYTSNFIKCQGFIKIKVFCGQKFVLTNSKRKQFILQVSLKGAVIDEEKNKKFSSQSVNEGFYSDFELECEFVVHCIDLAHIVFRVIDEEKKTMSYRAISFKNMREGVRTVQLLGPGMENELNSCLLVQMRFIPEKQRNIKLSSSFT